MSQHPALIPKARTPLQPGRMYRNRVGYRWRIQRVTNAGAGLPALALGVCLDADGGPDCPFRHAQWFRTDTWTWTAADVRADHLRPSPLDLLQECRP